MIMTLEDIKKRQARKHVPEDLGPWVESECGSHEEYERLEPAWMKEDKTEILEIKVNCARLTEEDYRRGLISKFIKTLYKIVALPRLTREDGERLIGSERYFDGDQIWDIRRKIVNMPRMKFEEAEKWLKDRFNPPFDLRLALEDFENDLF